MIAKRKPMSEETKKKIGNANRKHGVYKESAIYVTWCNMKQRCYNKNNIGYKNYGGRGIKICDRWLNSFENFYEDMGNKPIGMTLERINNNGDYMPNNCKWASWTDQHRNQRKNNQYTIRRQTNA